MINLRCSLWTTSEEPKLAKFIVILESIEADQLLVFADRELQTIFLLPSFWVVLIKFRACSINERNPLDCSSSFVATFDLFYRPVHFVQLNSLGLHFITIFGLEHRRVGVVGIKELHLAYHTIRNPEDHLSHTNVSRH